jgi:phosphate starvation-inducible PhoH-like protein
MIKKITLLSTDEAKLLCGPRDENIGAIEKECKVRVALRGEFLKLSGTATHIKKAAALVEHLLDAIRSGQPDINAADFARFLNSSSRRVGGVFAPDAADTIKITQLTVGKQIGPKTAGQLEYVEAIKKFDIVFGLGPAGTGKTYLAMACAVEALRKQEVRRIILTRPAIEAGESLGFLPGDMHAKIYPYLRPLYDALYDMMEVDRIEKYLETGIIEVAPLAYMRGRTLNDAFIILDEAQNCTPEQMKMFLTRLGFYSKAVITGDLTQSDLPEGKPAGLLQARDLLGDIEEIKFIYFNYADVVRHALVQRIIEAYEKNNNEK